MATDSGAARRISRKLPHPYAGSRKLAQRYEYSENSTAGFVELAPNSFGAASWDERFAAAEEFYDALAKVRGVAKAPGLHLARSDLHLALHFNLLSGAGFGLHCDWHLVLHLCSRWGSPGAASSVFSRRV